MKIKMDYNYAKGSFDLETGELSCIGQKDKTVDLCFSDSISISFAEILLQSGRNRDEAIYEDAVLLGKEIAKRWNEYRALKETINNIKTRGTGLFDVIGKEIKEGDTVLILYSDWIAKDINDKRSIDQYLKDISIKGSVYYNTEYAQFRVQNKEGKDIGSLMIGKHGRLEIILKE